MKSVQMAGITDCVLQETFLRTSGSAIRDCFAIQVSAFIEEGRNSFLGCIEYKKDGVLCQAKKPTGYKGFREGVLFLVEI